MTEHYYSRYRPWQSQVPQDVPQPDRFVPAALVVLCVLPTLLFHGAVHLPWLPQEPPPRNTPKPAPASNFSILSSGYDAPHKWGRVVTIPIVLDDGKCAQPVTVVTGYDAPHKDGRVTWVRATTQDNGPDRAPTVPVNVKGYPNPRPDGSVWLSSRRVFIDLQRLSPIFGSQVAAHWRPPFAGSVTMVSQGYQRNDDEHQDNTFPTMVVLEPQDRRRLYPGSVWRTGLDGREDPPEGQDKLSLALVVAAPHPNQLHYAGLAKYVARTIEEFDARPVRGIASIEIKHPLVHDVGFVWRPPLPREGDWGGRSLVVSPVPVPFPTSYSVWLYSTKEDDVTRARLTQQLVTSPVAGFMGMMMQSLGTGFIWYPAFGGAQKDDSLNRTTTPHMVASLRFNPELLRVFSGFTNTPTDHTPVSPVGDFCWRLNSPVSGWSFEIAGNDASEVPWNVSLSSGWTIGDPEC
jgi:hypothetical protein